jgi:uncharacterized membrane protein
MSKLHAAESLTNVVVGYVINLLLVYGLLHWLGYGIRMYENAGMSLVLAAVAFMRGYWIRKAFHKLSRQPGAGLERPRPASSDKP